MKAIVKNQNIVAAVAAVCLAGVALGAHAGEVVNEAAARTVHYADLNLNTQVGAARLYARIRTAAEQVCGDVGNRQLERAAAAKVCLKQAVYAGVKAVNNPMLTKEYAAQAGTEKPIEVAALR